MTSSHHHPVDVLRFAHAQRQPYALMAVGHVSGGTMRGVGALMCVTESGETAGYISNGCVDADIVLQARESLKAGVPYHLHYGEGSPYKDISLPCGGRIESICVPNPAADEIARVVEALSARKPAELSIGTFKFNYNPKIQLRILGRGEAAWGLAMQAEKTGFEVIVHSPDETVPEGFAGISYQHLTSPSQIKDTKDDLRTAVVLMFHDHDWEPAILSHVLEGLAFYVGAMGSRRTHIQRKNTLRAHGLAEEDIERIHGPIGLIPSMRDANLLALSTLAQIVSVAQEKDLL